MRRRVALLFLVCATSTVALVAGTGSAGAEYGPLAEYQVAFSFNCNNPTACGSSLGGFWGWAVFNTDGTADAELTGCFHLPGGPGGAQHFSSDATGWFVGANGDFYISHEDVTYVGHGMPVSMTDPTPPYPMDTGIPATPGHYSTDGLLGFQAPPGVAIQIQVTEIPNR